MEAICEEIDRDPKQVFLIDVVPNLRFLLRCGAITADPEYELKKFTQKVSLAQSVLIERVATQEVSAVWSIATDLHVKLAQKSSSSSSISINNGGYYDINNDPLLGTHILRIGMQEVRKIST